MNQKLLLIQTFCLQTVKFCLQKFCLRGKKALFVNPIVYLHKLNLTFLLTSLVQNDSLTHWGLVTLEWTFGPWSVCCFKSLLLVKANLIRKSAKFHNLLGQPTKIDILRCCSFNAAILHCLFKAKNPYWRFILSYKGKWLS